MDVPNGISALGSDSPITNALDLDLDLDSDPDSDKPKIRSLEREQYIQAVVESPQLPKLVDEPLIWSDMNGKWQQKFAHELVGDSMLTI